MVEIMELDLPTFWASALINGDTSGLEPDDCAALDQFTSDMIIEHGKCWCVGCDTDTDSGDFRKYHDATRFGVLACNVTTFQFDIG